MNKARFFRGMASIFLAIAVIFSVAQSVGNAWAGRVNELLGVTRSGIERSLDPEDYRYTSDYENPADLVAAEIACGTRAGVEGSVALKGAPAIEGRKVTLQGTRSTEKMQFGGSMGELVEPSQCVPLADALTREGFSVNPGMVRFYAERAAMILNIVGSFGKDHPLKKGGKIALSAVGCALLVGILIPSLMLGGMFAPKTKSGATVAGSDGAGLSGTYTVRLSGAEGNTDLLQDCHFQCANLKGLMNVDTRLTLDLALTLNDDGSCALFSDACRMEAGKRAEIGDDTGLGMISQLNAEGTCTVNSDGTVTTSPAQHATFTLELDTCSSQMRDPANYAIGEEKIADGACDSADHPAILDNVPETVWTLNDDFTIASYEAKAEEEAGAEEEAQSEPAEETPAAESVTVESDDAATKMVFFSDSSYTFLFESCHIEDAGTYTFEGAC